MSRIKGSSREIQRAVKQRTEKIAVPPVRRGALEDRDYLEKLYLRLIPFVYDYPELPLENLIQYAAPRLVQAETAFLLGRLSVIRRTRNVITVSQGEEDLLLPLTAGFDPREVPLVACWCDGGFYNSKERQPGKQNSHKLRGLGLYDGVAGYASLRALIFNPQVGHPAWKEGPFDTGTASGSFEAEVKAAEAALAAVISRLEREKSFPPVDQFHLVLYSDCQSLVKALSTAPRCEGEEMPSMLACRRLAAAFARVHFTWLPRRLIKQKLGH